MGSIVISDVPSREKWPTTYIHSYNIELRGRRVLPHLFATQFDIHAVYICHVQNSGNVCQSGISVSCAHSVLLQLGHPQHHQQLHRSKISTGGKRENDRTAAE